MKANIGHTEAASGAAAVIKAVLMLQKGRVPVQANFNNLNPKLSSLERDNMRIPMETQRWDGTAVCVNNYGAAGSNAAMIVCKAPENHLPQEEVKYFTASWKKLPLLLSAHSETSLRAYCIALHRLLTQRGHGPNELADVLFALAHRANNSLSTSIATSVSSINELKVMTLDQLESKRAQFLVDVPRRPSILCFGGQTKAWVGLSEDFYKTVMIFKMHLDCCESVCRSLDVTGFYPKIFSKTPIEDVVLLQCMLFSLQYACAKSWIDCSLQVDVVIGHSLGQLTALCVSGSMSLLQAMKFIAGRAKLIRDFWGPERGTMLSVDAEEETVRKALSLVNRPNRHHVEIACFNSSSTCILAGSKASIEALESILMDGIASPGDAKVRKLEVTHAFHSHLMDPILPKLAKLADSIDFHEPRIQIQTCSKDRSWARVDAQAVTQLSREPVYFSEAVNRIAEEKGPCNWIEAGTDSGIATMVRRALDASVRTEHTFHPMSLTSRNSVDLLASATVNLWQTGSKVQFWPYHRFQRHGFKKIPVPPYQFEKHRHWLDYKEMSATEVTTYQDPGPMPKLLSFIYFIRPQNSTQSLAEYMIDPNSRDFKYYIQGHKVLGTGSCPASVYIHLAAQALAELSEEEDGRTTEGTFCINQLEMQSPLGLDSQRMISLSLESWDHTPGTWSFRICSRDPTDTLKVTSHASGTIYFQTAESLATTSAAVRNDTPSTQDGVETSIEGNFIYTVFSTVVEYATHFKGLQKVSARGSDITGLISFSETQATPPQHDGGPLCDPAMIDNMLQVAGLYINCLRQYKSQTVFVCSRILTFHLYFQKQKQQHGPWRVACRAVSADEKHIIYDITASHAQSQKTVAQIFGARFTGVPIAALTKTLSKLGSTKLSKPVSNQIAGIEGGDKEAPNVYPILDGRVSDAEPKECLRVVVEQVEKGDLKDRSSEINRSNNPEELSTSFTQLQQLLNSATDVPIEDMHRYSLLENIGVDSLMTIEVLGEIEKAFEIDITMSEFEKVRDLGSLCSLAESKVAQRLRHVVQPLEPVIKSNVTMNSQDSVHLELAHDGRTAATVAISSKQKANSEGPSMVGEKGSIKLDTRNDCQDIFDSLDATSAEFIRIANDTRLSGFTKHANLVQIDLVVAYIVEAFSSLGCDLQQLENGDSVSVAFAPQHTALMEQLHRILEHAALIHRRQSGSVRTATPINISPSQEIHQRLIQIFPQHIWEHRLLGTMGPRLARYLCGSEDPVHVLFGDKASKELLTEVYTKAPMFATGTRLLSSFLSRSFATKRSLQPIRILEVGGGVGGTTGSIIELLESSGQTFTYTFTDISPSLVAAAKKRFAGHHSMDFKVLDVEAEPPDGLLGNKDLIIATNVVHATKSLKETCTHIRKLLHKNGILCLVELTRNLDWFDLVFGPLEGWWRFEDGRKHAIADVQFWELSLNAAGFDHVAWTGDGTEEGDIVRLMIASASDEALVPESSVRERAQTTMETIPFKYVERIPLFADIYYPEEVQKTRSKRPIGKFSRRSSVESRLHFLIGSVFKTKA